MEKSFCSALITSVNVQQSAAVSGVWRGAYLALSCVVTHLQTSPCILSPS